jgi:hypothetical protein
MKKAQYIATAIKQNIRVFDALKAAVKGLPLFLQPKDAQLQGASVS